MLLNEYKTLSVDISQCIRDQQTNLGCKFPAEIRCTQAAFSKRIC